MARTLARELTKGKREMAFHRTHCLKTCMHMLLVCSALLLSALSAFSAETISINRDDTALDLTKAISIFRDRGETFQVSTAPDSEGIVRTIEVQASNRETAGDWAVMVLANTTDQQIDRLIVAPHFRMAGSGLLWPDLGSDRIVAMTPSSGFSLDRLDNNDADIFSITLNPGSVVTLVAELSSPHLPQVYLWEESAYKEIENSYTFYRGIVLGISGLLALFLTILFVVRGTSTFPAAAALAWAVLAYITIDFGFIEQLIPLSNDDLRTWRALSEVAISATLALFLFTHLSLNRWNDSLHYGAIAWVIAIVLLSSIVLYDATIAAGIARLAMALTAAFGFALIIVLSLRGFDRAIMLIPAWALLMAWIFGGWMTVTGQVDNDIIQPALAGGLVLIVLLIGFTVMQHAFSGGTFQQNLFSNVELQALAVTGSGGIVWDWDVGRDRLTTTPDLGRKLGIGVGALQGPAKNWLKHIHSDDRDSFRTALDAVVEQRRGKINLDIRLMTQENHFTWYKIKARPVAGANGEVIRCIGTASDVSGQKRAEERLLHDAVHDNLTGLPNRELFFDRIRSVMALSAVDTEIRPTVFIVDLDRFKEINDNVGISAGDTLLITVARRLRRLLRPHDTLARIGGDVFGILLLSETDPTEIANLADQLKKTIKAPISFAEREFVITPSVGLATWAPSRVQGDDLFKDAELALHQAKRFGGDRVEPFRPAFRDTAGNEVQLVADLRRAIERSELTLAYQPIVKAATGHVSGFEALLRWNHPRRGEVSPSEFVPLAEKNGLISDLGRYALELAAMQLMDWDAIMADTPIFVSVNVSAQQVGQRDFVNMVDGILARYPVRNHTLRLEITETTLMQNPEQNCRVLENIKKSGIKLAIDDFGTGYSSLSYLTRFPFDTLKIDQSFMRSQPTNRDVMLRSIVDMAHSLNLDVVCEGVEDDEEVTLLRGLGVDYIQGFVAGAAMSSTDAAEIVIRQNPLIITDAAAE